MSVLGALVEDGDDLVQWSSLFNIFDFDPKIPNRRTPVKLKTGCFHAKLNREEN
jgi:hypothetical protein